MAKARSSAASASGVGSHQRESGRIGQGDFRQRMRLPCDKKCLGDVIDQHRSARFIELPGADAYTGVQVEGPDLRRTAGALGEVNLSAAAITLFGLKFGTLIWRTVMFE